MLAALDLVEREGIAALTMRQVASALHVTPMSLYNHVADKAELLDLMLDYVIGDVVRASVGDEGTWEERLRAVARRNHEMWGRHREFAEVYLDGVTMGPNALANVERILGILREAGCGDEDAAHAFFVLWHFSVASILVGRTKPVEPARRGAHSDGTAEGRIETYFSSLPVGDIPNVAALAMHLGGDCFEFGLELIISGLRLRIDATRAPATGGARPAPRRRSAGGSRDRRERR